MFMFLGLVKVNVGRCGHSLDKVKVDRFADLHVGQFADLHVQLKRLHIYKD